MTPEESQTLWGAIVTAALTLLPAITAYLVYVLHEQMNKTATKVDAQHEATMQNQAALSEAVAKLNTLLTTSTPTNADLSKQISASVQTLKQNGAKP